MAFFKQAAIPEPTENRVLHSQINLMFEFLLMPEKQAIMDARLNSI